MAHASPSTWAMLIFSLMALLLSAATSHLAAADGTDYGIVFDAGSSGTRVYVYSWAHRTADPDNRAPFSVPATRTEWSKKENKPLSSFAGDAANVGTLLHPLLDFAKDILDSQSPSPSYKDVPIFLGATAGMRLVSEADRRDIMAETRAVFTASGFSFTDAYAKILSGEEEALFGWLAVNFMKNTLAPQVKKLKLSQAQAQAQGSKQGSLLNGAQSELAAAARERRREHVIGMVDSRDSALELPAVAASASAVAEARNTHEGEDEEEIESPLSQISALLSPLTRSHLTSDALTVNIVASALYGAATSFFTAPAPSDATTSSMSLLQRAQASLSAAASAAAAQALPPSPPSASASASSPSFAALAATAALSTPAPASVPASTADDDDEDGDDDDKDSGMWGAMDLGGASTQLIYTPPSDPLANHVEYIEPMSGNRHNLYGVSHLGFGINAAIKSLYLAMLNEVPEGETTGTTPCFNPGYTAKVFDDATDRSVELTGTGDYAGCAKIAESILSLNTRCYYDKCSINGVYLPVINDDARFLAFSTFPLIMIDAGLKEGFISINEMIERTSTVTCALDWKDAEGKQRATGCMAMSYVIALFHKAYGFKKDLKQISFEVGINDTEISWATGFVLYQVNLLEFEGLIKAVVALLIVIGVFVSLSVILGGIVAYLLYKRSKTRSDSLDKPLYANQYAIQQDRVIVAQL